MEKMTMAEILAMPEAGRKATKEDGWITIHGPYPYEIEASRAETPEQIISWVLHLTEKDWVTAEHVHDFIEAAGFNYTGRKAS